MINRESLLLYAVTDRLRTSCTALYEQIEEALCGGVTCVQLREKHLDEEAFTKEAEKVKSLCERYGVPLIINDNLSVALKSGADGIHVGQNDMPASEIRKIAGDDFIIGVTAKTVMQARKAEKDGADYIGVGAVFPSPTKKDAISITISELKEICSCVSIPSVAIGGINLLNMSKLSGGGMDGFAVVSAIFGADDIRTAAKALKEKAKLTV